MAWPGADGRARVFGPGELSAEAVLASACLPQMFPAVEIDGEARLPSPPMAARPAAG
jgi:predicted acylesterase/phospholipase RssA